ncbi:MAG: hypothetical protein Tsb0034_02750 [Ekhidna sp.]
MDFYIGTGTKNNFLEISEEEFQAIKTNKEILMATLNFEGRYEIFVKNYIDFEKEILIQSIPLLLSGSWKDHDDLFEEITLFDVKISNLLSSARLYRDHILKDSGSLFDLEINNLFSHEFDTSQEFRFMEKFRNYVQHKGLPVSRITKRVKSEGDKRKHIIDIYCSKKNLDFNPKYIDELEDQINLKKSIRHYMSSVSSIHVKIRGLIRDKFTASTSMLKKQIEEYRTKSNNHNFIQAHSPVESVDLSIVKDIEKTILKKQKINRELIKLESRVISNEIV